MANIAIYPLTDTLNNSVNEEKLNFELKTSPISQSAFAYKFGNEIFVRFEVDALSSEDIARLDTLISTHDGVEAEVTQVKVNIRELGIRELVQLAFYHPLLDNDTTTAYLTTIDNFINGFIRSGNYNVLVAKIQADSLDTEGEYYDYLNLIVNTKGNKTFEYFIGTIMSIQS